MEILKVDSEAIQKSVDYIKKGKVIVCPTDTIYGLICDAGNKKAVQRIFKIKKRPRKKPIPIFIKNLEWARNIAKINKKQEKFLESIWPGKVTVVLKKKKTRTKMYGIDKETVALRVPRYYLINIFFRKINFPITGTSANIAGKPASTKIKEVLKQFENQKNQPDLIINAGNLITSKPSTVDATLRLHRR